MPDIITNDVLIIENGETSSGLTVGTSGEIDVMAGGTLADSFATTGGMIYVDTDGIVQRISASGESDIYVMGDASDLTVESKGQFDIDGTLDSGLIKDGGIGTVYDLGTASGVTVLSGGRFLNSGGIVRDTAVMSGGSFTVQFTTAQTSGTSVYGGTMRVNSAGNAFDTLMDGGLLDVLSGSVSNTVVSGGTMLLTEAAADTTVLSGGVMRVVSGNTIGNTTVNGGQLEANSVVATDTNVQAGTAVFSSSTISGLEVGSGASVTLDNASTLVGTLVFAPGATVTVGGILAFDTAYTTMVNAQVTGLSAVTGDASYTLNPDAAVGTYKLATDAAGFTSAVTFGDQTLTTSDDVAKYGDLYYKLLIANTNDLILKVMDDNEGDVFFTGHFAGGSKSMLARSVFGYVEIYSSDTGEVWGTLNFGYSGNFVSVGDFNGDGFDDILRTNYAGQFFYDLSNGDGTFTAQDLGFDAGTWDEMGTGDFSGNGIDDILLADPNAYSDSDPNAGQLAYKEYNAGVSLINVYRDGWDMLATGNFGTASSTSPDAPPDAKADMLWQNTFTGIDDKQYYGFCTWITDSSEDSYWRMIGAVRIEEWDFLGVGDFNGDGTSDFAVINSDGIVAIGGVKNGTLSYWGVLNAVDTSEWRFAGTGDFNGDGTDDIAWCNSGNLAGYWQINDMQTTDWGTIGWLG